MQVELHQLHRKYEALRLDDAEARSQLLAGISRDGQRTPVVVVRADRAERFVLIDGYQRVRALEALSRDVIDAVILDAPEDMALAMSHGLQKGRQPSALEEGWLLHALMVEHGHKQAALATLLSRSPAWVSRRLSMVSTLPESVQDAVRVGRVGARGAMRALVPLARANAADCERLVERLPKPSPSSRDMERLYNAWRRGSDEVKARIVERPGLWLKAQRDGAATEPAIAELQRDIAMLCSIAARARRRVDTGAIGEASATQRKRIEHALDEARLIFGGLVASFDEHTHDPPAKEPAHARPGHPDRDSATAA